jgi:acetyl-CoA carboxylase biotin carboxyl carrier protein
VPKATEIEGLVRSLVGMVREGGISELDVAYGRVSIRLRGAAALAPAGAVELAVVPASTDAGVAEPVPESIISAPMIGTFYASPAPGEPPFVEVGDPVEIGQTVGIIEAMKIMNEITADRAGVVATVLVGNGQPVEYGSPLLRLHAAGDESA